MARYKINRGPRYGEIVHLPQSQEINLALILGDIEALPDEAAPPARPIFGIAPTSNGADVCILLTLPSGEKVRYAGPAKGAKDGFKRRVWSGEKQDYVFDGPEPPADILAQYTALKGQHERDAAASMAAHERAARHAVEHNAAQATKAVNAAVAAMNEGNI